MELRMRPRNEGYQRPQTYEVTTSSRAQIMSYRDYLGNTIDHFNIPAEHTKLTVTMTALVEMSPMLHLPDAIDPNAWQIIDRLIAQGDYWEMIHPSQFAKPTDLLVQLANEFELQRRDDPLTLLRELNLKTQYKGEQ